MVDMGDYGEIADISAVHRDTSAPHGQTLILASRKQARSQRGWCR
jgi:hypothetical protein